jgi:hypothetical protein
MSRWSGGVMRIVMVLVLAGVTSASAAPVDMLFQQFGLFGTWAADCRQPASPANAHVVITTPSPGLVLEDHNLGPSFAVNHYRMLWAERLSDEQMSVAVVFQPGTDEEERQKLVFLVRKNTRRTMLNESEGGTVRVKDGIMVERASSTPVLNKCE